MLSCTIKYNSQAHSGFLEILFYSKQMAGETHYRICVNVYFRHVNIYYHECVSRTYQWHTSPTGLLFSLIKKTRDCYRNHIREFMWLNSELCFCTWTTLFIIVIVFYDYIYLSWVVSNDTVELNSWPLPLHCPHLKINLVLSTWFNVNPSMEKYSHAK